MQRWAAGPRRASGRCQQQAAEGPPQSTIEPLGAVARPRAVLSVLPQTVFDSSLRCPPSRDQSTVRGAGGPAETAWAYRPRSASRAAIWLSTSANLRRSRWRLRLVNRPVTNWSTMRASRRKTKSRLSRMASRSFSSAGGASTMAAPQFPPMLILLVTTTSQYLRTRRTTEIFGRCR